MKSDNYSDGISDLEPSLYSRKVTRLVDGLKSVGKKVKDNKGKIIGTIIYEGLTGAWIYSLINFFSHPYAGQLVLKESRIPEQSSLYPWPLLNKIGSGPFNPNITRPLEVGEKVVAYIYQNPVLLVPIIAAPAIAYGIKKGVDHYRKGH